MSTTTPLLTLVKPAVTDAALISVINSNMDILDNAATLTGAQTLTNKTLTSPTLTSPHLTTATVDSGGLTITSGGLTITAGNLGVGAAPAAQYGVNVAGSINTVGGAAVGVIITPTLVAQANSDGLYGLYVAPTYNDNGKTGVGHNGAYIAGPIQVSGTVPATGAGILGIGAATAASASAGASGAVPAQVVGYLAWNISGTVVKIPYFAT